MKASVHHFFANVFRKDKHIVQRAKSRLTERTDILLLPTG